MQASRFCIVAMSLLLAAPAAAQQEGSTLSAFVEALGPTEFVSLNLEGIVDEQWALRGGLQIAGSGRSLGQHYAQFPLSISRIEFVRGFGLEGGIGSVITVNGQYEHDGLESFGSAAVRTPVLFGGAFLRVEGVVMPSQAWRKTIGVAVGYSF